MTRRFISRIGTLRVEGGRIVLDTPNQQAIELVPTAKVPRQALQAKVGVSSINVVGTCTSTMGRELQLEVSGLSDVRPRASRLTPMRPG